MRCPNCNSPSIHKVISVNIGTPLYQCQQCGQLFGRTQKGELFKGEPVSHKFNPTARDGID